MGDEVEVLVGTGVALAPPGVCVGGGVPVGVPVGVTVAEGVRLGDGVEVKVRVGEAVGVGEGRVTVKKAEERTPH